MSEATRRSLSTNRKKRGVVRASITKLRSRVEELEVVSSPDTADQEKHLTTRLETLFEEFKVTTILSLLCWMKMVNLHKNKKALMIKMRKLIGSLSAWTSLFPPLTTASSRLLPIDWSIWKRAFLQSSARSLCHLLMRMMSVSFNSWRNSCQNSKRNF